VNTEALVVVLAGICHWLFWDRFLSEKEANETIMNNMIRNYENNQQDAII